MQIKDLKLYEVSFPLPEPVGPYMWARGVVTESNSIIVEIETTDGIVGWGETHGSYPKRHTRESFSREALKELKGRNPTEVELVREECDLGSWEMLAGIEMALWDIIGKSYGQPLYNLLGGKLRDWVQMAACLGIRPPAESARIAVGYVEKGFSTLKTKAGRDPEMDFNRIKAMREAVGDNLQLRLDPNQNYYYGTALDLALKLESYRLQYFEQPCSKYDLDALARLRKNTTTPIALNESVEDAASMLDIVKHQAADYVLPDFPQGGGLLEVKKVAAIAEAADIPCVMHCGFDLGLKTAAMVHVVASTRCFSFANDSVYYIFPEDVTVEPLEIKGDLIKVPDKPGLGVEVDRGKLEEYKAG